VLCAKCFSFHNCRVILVGSESYVLSNYSHYCQEERCGKKKLDKFCELSPELLFLVFKLSPIVRER